MKPRFFGRRRDGAGYTLPTPARIRIVNDRHTLRTALAELDDSEEVSSDIETNRLSPYLDNPKIISLGFGTRRHQWLFPVSHRESNWTRADIRGVANRLKGHYIIGQNWKFDAQWIWEILDVRIPVSFDVMLAAHITDENRFLGLDNLAFQYFGAKNWDIPLEEKQGNAPYRRIADYHGLDLYYTYHLKRPLAAELDSDPSTRRIYYDLRIPSANNFVAIERDGVYLDPTKLDDAQEYWEEKRDTALTRLDELFPTDRVYKIKKTKEKRQGYNWNSPQQVAHCLFTVAGLTPLDRTPKGAISTSESVLNRLKEEHEAPRLIVDFREAEKQLNTYLENFRGGRDRRGFIHPPFKLTGTVTGRLSSDFHTIPRDPRIRSLFTADPGWTLVEADYSQIELRLVADASGDPELKMAYQTGQDIHTLTVQRIIGIQNPDKEERKKGKAINFGFVYGMWWKKFIIVARDDYGIIFTPAEAKKIRKGFFRMYNRLPAWHVRQKQFAHRNGYVRSIIGYKRRLPMLEDVAFREGFDDRLTFEQSEAQRQAVNAPIQSMASHLMEMSAVEIAEKTKRSYLRTCALIHDAGLFRVRNDCLGEMLPLIKETMEAPKLLKQWDVHISVPLVAELKVGPWGASEEIKDLPKYLKRLSSAS